MNRIFKQPFRFDSGFSALMSVLFFGSIGISITAALMLLGVSSIKSSISGDEGDRARFMADLCAEEALQSLWKDNTYVGGDSVSVDGLDCNVVAVTGTGNTNRVVQSQSTVGEATRRVEVDVSVVRPRIILNYWQEVSNF